MNMHPKPALRHTHHVEPFAVETYFNNGTSEPLRMKFTREADGATQLLTMTEDEATKLFEQLAVMLRYRDTPIAEVALDDWRDFNAALRGVLKGQF